MEIQQRSTRQELIRLIRDAGGCTLADLQQRTGLSRSTLRQHLARLAHDGIIESDLVKRSSGRPPLVFRVAAQAELAAPATYVAFLRALFAGLQAQGREQIEALFRQVADGVAAQHPDIRALPNVRTRLDAARRLFFSDLETTEVQRTDDGYGFSLYTCPLASLAGEFGDVCCVTRSILSRLTGAPVEQTEWIIRGDPRCTFLVRAGPAAAGSTDTGDAMKVSPARPAAAGTAMDLRQAASPMAFSFVGIPRDPALLELAIGLRQVFVRHGHRYQQAPEGDVRVVFNFIDPKRPRPYRRRGQGTFVVSVTLTDQRPEDLLKEAYPLLIRSLANLCIYLVRAEDRIETYFVTLEQGYYRTPDLTGDAYFAYLYERLLPLASSELVIDNEFHPDLPEELWEGDELTEQLAGAGRRLEALHLLPTPFPIQELLSAREFRHVERLFGIGGLSYGNLSVRKDATCFWMSASGVNKANMRVIGQDMLLVKGFDPQRKVMLLSIPPDIKPRRVSVDAIEHWTIYTEHPSVGAIVHVHAWMEGVASTTVNYPCGTIQLAQAVADLVRRAPDPACAVVGLRNHGLTITGRTLADIFDRLKRGFIRQVPMS